MKKRFLSILLSMAMVFSCCFASTAVAAEPDEKAGPVMTTDQISLQLYTIRSLVNSEVRGNYDAIKALLQQVKDIGYNYVEPYDFWGLNGAQWAQVLAETGLKVSSIHQNVVPDDQIPEWVATVKAMGLDNIFINYGGFMTYADGEAFVERIVAFRDKVAPYGIKVNFHTHNHEYMQPVNEDGTMDNSTVIMDKILNELNADLELDLHWAARAGRDPATEIRSYAGRATYLHMKDLSFGDNKSFIYEELGEGVLDFDEIVRAANEVGVKFFVVEQDGNHINGDPMESARISFNYLKDKFCDPNYQYPEKPVLDKPLMTEDQISVQLYSIRDKVTSEVRGNYDAVKALLQQVRDIGYKNVELYNFWGLNGAQWRSILDEVGLNVISIHQNIIGDEQIPELVENLKAIGLDNIFIANGSFSTYEASQAFVANIQTFREKLAAYGITVNYHTHSQEFIQPTNEDGTMDNEHVVLDDIIADGANVELDVHWAARAGRNPVDEILRYGEKITYLHMKDLSLGDNLSFVYEELGEGVLDLPAVVQAANKVGVKYFVVEQDGNHIGGDSMASIQITYNYLKNTFCAPMSTDKISLQLYTIRDKVNNDVRGNYDAVKALLQQVRDIGYKNVELYNFWGLSGAQWKSILDEVGLKVSSIHQNMIGDEQIPELVENLKAIGLDNIFIASGGFSTYEDSQTFLANVQAFREKLAAYGIAVNFHTHSQEFIQPTNKNGTTDNEHVVLDDIIADGANVELDVHWAARAGRDPAAEILKYGSKITYVHMKDLSFGDNRSFLYEELGEGALDFDEIVKAANEVGVKFFVVEQDGNHIGGDSMESARISFNYLKNTFCTTDYQYPEKPALDDPTMTSDQISLQLYSIRSLVTKDIQGDPIAIRDLLQKVRSIGYKNVELYNFWGISGAQWKNILDSLGMNVTSIHQNVISDDKIPELVENLKAIGLDNIFIANGSFSTYEASQAFVANVQAFREKLAAYGITVNYHTHSQEFIQPTNEDGTMDNQHVVLDDIIADGANVELDVHWAARAGRNPAAEILNYGDKITYVHMKDLAFGDNRSFIYEELGEGVLDLPAVVQAANKVGVKYFVVEQDGNHINGDPLAAVKISYDYLRDTFCTDAPEAPVDKSLLIDSIVYALEQQQNYPEYLIESVKERFEAALAAAIAVRDDNTATQEMVDAADDYLVEMIQYLSFTADPTGLLNAIEKAVEASESGKYLDDENMDNLLKEIDIARALLDAPVTTTEYEAEVETLLSLIDKLVEKTIVNTAILEKEIADAKLTQEVLDRYLDGKEKTDFLTMLEKAEAVLAEALAGTSNQNAVNEAALELHRARLSLRLIPNKEALKELLDQVNSMDLTPYTAESVVALKAALAEANAVYQNPQADAGAVTEAVNGLKAAVANLKALSSGSETPSTNPSGNGSDSNKTDNTQTGDNTPFVALSMATLLALAAVVVLRKRIKL